MLDWYINGINLPDKFAYLWKVLLELYENFDLCWKGSSSDLLVFVFSAGVKHFTSATDITWHHRSTGNNRSQPSLPWIGLAWILRVKSSLRKRSVPVVFEAWYGISDHGGEVDDVDCDHGGGFGDEMIFSKSAITSHGEGCLALRTSCTWEPGRFMRVMPSVPW